MRTRTALSFALAAVAFAVPESPAAAQLENYRDNPQSLKFPKGSSAERRARMAAVARNPA